MTTLNLKFFTPGDDGYTAKSMSFEPVLNAERNTANDDKLAVVLADRTLSLDAKYDMIRANIAKIVSPTIDTDNKFTI